ncbi:MAG: hypothetical protein V1711_00205 [bacterium]
MIKHHAFVIEAEAEDGIKMAQEWAVKELGMKIQNNPDVIVLRYGLLTIDDARKIFEVTAGAAFAGEHRVIIIAASRAYHEAQNALLKLFEEPSSNTFLFLIFPSLGGLLPTLRSRVQIMNTSLDIGSPTSDVGLPMSYIPKGAEEFIRANKEKRSAIIKKLTSGKDEEERRELRDEAITMINGIESIAYSTTQNVGFTKSNIRELLSDIAILRTHLYDRSAPVRMILEHLSLVIPEGLSNKV